MEWGYRFVSHKQERDSKISQGDQAQGEEDNLDECQHVKRGRGKDVTKVPEKEQKVNTRREECQVMQRKALR